MPLDYNQFAEKIKAKYPEYKDVDNLELTKKMIAKYPEYKNQVTLDVPKKKKSTSKGSQFYSKALEEVGLSAIDRPEKQKASVSSGSKDLSYAKIKVNSAGETVVTETVTINPQDVVKPGDLKTRKDLFTGYPGKEKNIYRLDTVAGVPVWLEKNDKGAPLPNGQKLYDKVITDPARVAALNKQFGKKASTSKEEEVFVGYPGKELNEYRVRDGEWQRRLPKATTWEPLHKKETIQTLNYQFGKKVEYNAAKAKYSGVTEDLEKVKEDQLNSNLKLINSKIIGQSEEQVVPLLRSAFPDFEFSEEGFMTDEMLVRSRLTDKIIRIPLDNFTHGDDLNRSLELQEFIRANSNKELEESKNKMLGFEAAVSKFNPQPVDVKIRLGEGEGDVQSLLDIQGSYGSTDQPSIDIMTANIKAKEARADYFKKSKETFIDAKDKMKYAMRTGSTIDDRSAQAAFANLEMDNSVIKSSNNYMNDISEAGKNLEKQYNDLSNYSEDIKTKYESGQITLDQLNNEYIPQINKMSADLETKRKNIESSFGDVYTFNSQIEEAAANNLIIKESTGTVGGGIAYNFSKGLTDVLRGVAGAAGAESKDTKAVQEDIIRAVVGYGTTAEYMASDKRNDLTKVLFSLSQTAGNIVGSGGLGGLAKSVGASKLGVKTAELVPFYATSYYELKDQFDGPDFEDVSDAEKVLMSSLYGLGVGALEKFGVSKALSSSPLGKNFTNMIIKNTFKDLPKNASKEMIELAISNNIKKQLASKGVNTVAAMLTEFSTEATQEGFGIGLKEAYDAVKGKDYFKSGTAWEITGQIIEAGYLGAIGGGIMQIPAASYDMVKNSGKLNNIDQMKLMEMTVNDADMRAAMFANIKGKVITKELTKQEGREQIKAVKDASAIFNKLPENLNDSDKLTAVNLLTEKITIESKIEGKDPALVSAQKERINAINEELKTISQNATKENNVEQQEGTTEGSTVEYQGAVKGQQEVGTTEGTVGQATQQKTDTGDSTVASEVQQEEVKTLRAQEQQELNEAIPNIEEYKVDGEINKESMPADVLAKYNEIYDKYDAKITPLLPATETAATQVEQVTPTQEKTFEVHVGGIESGFTESAESKDKSPGDIRNEIESAPEDYGVIVTKGTTNGATENDTFVVAYSKIGGDRQRITEKNGGRSGWVSASVKISENATEQEIAEAKAAATAKMNAILPNIKGGKFVLSSVDASTSVTIGEAKTGKAVAEQVKPATKTVEQEVEELGQLVEGSDVEIDRIANTIPDKRMAKIVSRAAKAISRITPGVKFKIHATDAEYRLAVDESTEEDSSNGTFNPATNTVHINLTKANSRTVAHEVFHAILLNKVRTNKDAAAVTKKMIEAISSKLDGMPDLKKYLDDFASNYEENIQSEEKLSELVGILAENYMNAPTSVKDVIYRWIDRLAKMFGLDPFQRNEVYDMLNTIARKTAKGKVIKESEVKIIPTSKEISDMNKRFQADFSDPMSKLTFVFDKNGDKFKKLEDDGYITKNKSIKDFNGKYIYLHQPDAAFSGMIYKDGEILVEGKGGVFYPIKFHEDGYFWASTKDTAATMAKQLNVVMQQNGGTIYMALTSAPYDKLMSSTTMSNAVLDFFLSKAFDKTFKLSEAQLKSSLIKAANDVKIKKSKNKKGEIVEKRTSLNLNLTSKMTIEEIKSAIRTALNPDVNVFGDRKNFSEELIKLMATEINKNDVAINQFGKLFSEGIQNKYFKGITKTGKLKISTTNMIQALSEMFTEPMLKEGVNRKNGGQVYAILELNGAVEPFKTEQHESYPMAIKSSSDSKVKLNILTDRQNWFDVFEDPDTNEIVTKDRLINVFPTTGVSNKGLKLNTSKIEGTTKEETDTTKRQQKKVYNASPKGITELGKRSGVVYFATDKREADAYAQMNRGKVREFEISEADIVDEKVVRDKITVLGLMPKDKDYTVEESNVYELIDNRFDNSLSDSDIKKLFDALKQDGIVAFSYEDGAQVSGRTTESIAVIDTDVVQGMLKKQQNKKQKDINKVTKLAKSKGFSNEAIVQYLRKEGFSEDQINEVLAPYIFKDDIAQSFSQEVDRLVSEGATEENAFNEAMDNIVYKIEDDIVREELARELMKEYDKKIKSAPRAEKIIGKAKPITITTNDVKGLNDIIKREAKAAKDKKKQIDEVIATIAAQVKDLVTKGSISIRQMSAIINALKNTNFDNQVMVDRFMDYVLKVVSNADYIERVNKGLNFKKAIKRNLKGRANPFVSVAKSFTELNPKWVVDINKYNEIAELVFNSVKPTRITRKDDKFKVAKTAADERLFGSPKAVSINKGRINFKKEADIEVIAKYIAEEQENHLKIYEANVRDRYERITGEKSKGKTIGEMNTILVNLKGDKKDYSSQITAELKEKLAEYKKMVTNEDLAEVKAAVNVDLNLIDNEMAISILDALDTYFANGSNASLKAIMATYGGIVAVNEFNGKAKALRMLGSKRVGRFQNEQFTNINMMFKRLFRGQNAGQAFSEAIGFNNLVQGSNRAERQSVDKQNEYTKKFKNVKNFNSAENIFERNVIAWLRRRDVNANEQDSFNNRLKLLKDSVDVLRKSGTTIEKEKANVYEKVFKKLGLYDDNVSIEDVLGKSEKFNIDAVDFVTEMWSDIYNQLSDTALGVYNTMLANDINYTPDKFTNLDSFTPSEFDVESSGFMSFNSNYTLDKNSAGVLMETTRPSKLPDNMYIDLDFDRNMFRSYKLALNDMYTAEAIRHTNAFLKSDKFKEIVPTAEDRGLIASSIQGYVSAKKGKNYIQKSEMNFLNSFLDAVGGFGAARALAGFSQFINQWTTANVNTLINAGEYMRPLDFYNKDVATMIANSGLPISNVGIEALTTIENADKELEKAGIVATVGGVVDKYTLSYLKKSNAFLLKQLLANPDRFARVQAFAAYYRKSMAQQGLKADFKAPMNEKAAKYAQSMIDANMDVSDTEMRGQFFKSKNAYVKIIKQVFFPFATFSMNQRNRVWSDFAIGWNKLSSKEDKIAARRSLAAFSAEFITYNAIRYGVGLLIMKLAVAALGLDDEEEEKIIKKYEENLMKSIKSSSITDVLSPTPVLDEVTLSAMNKMMPMFGIGTPTEEEFQKYIDGINEERIYKGKEKLTEDEVALKKDKFMLDEQFQFYIDNEKSTGMIGIQLTKIQELYDIVDAYYTGKYSRERFAGGGYEEVSLSDDAKESLKYIALLKLEGTLLGPRETDQIANRMFKIVKDTKTLTEAQKAKYDVIKKDYEIDPYKMSLIKTTMKTENVLKEIEYIESTGGLTEKQSKEYAKLRAFGEIDGWGLDDIRKGKTAKQIIASRQ